MKRFPWTRIPGLLLLLLMPFGLELSEEPGNTDSPRAGVRPPYSRESSLYTGRTRMVVGGGLGTYALVDRGCSGEVLQKSEAEFEDLGAGLEHSLNENIALGVRVGLYDHEAHLDDSVQIPDTEFIDPDLEFDRINRFVNPYVTIRTPHASTGIGLVVADKELPGGIELDTREHLRISGHLQIGNDDALRLRLSTFESVPLLSGGGPWTMGVGFPTSHSTELFAGVSFAEPFDEGAFLVRGSVRLFDRATLMSTARLGSSEGINENAFSLGLRLGFGDL